jgi:hypothetical protein
MRALNTVLQVAINALSVTDLLARYRGTDCIAPDGSLWEDTWQDVFRDLGFRVGPEYNQNRPLYPTELSQALENAGGYMIMVDQGDYFRHAVVIYGADGKTIKVMDPIDGAYHEISYSQLKYPINLVRLGSPPTDRVDCVKRTPRMK